MDYIIQNLLCKFDTTRAFSFSHYLKSWGMKLRFGLFEISEQDFKLIYSKMCGVS